MPDSFHLSIGVLSLDESVGFFTEVLGAKQVHADPSGYVNLEFGSAQLTLKQEKELPVDLPAFHFGINTDMASFRELEARIMQLATSSVISGPATVDAGTQLERRKISVRCPSGYLVEIKGQDQ